MCIKKSNLIKNKQINKHNQEMIIEITNTT